MKQEAIHRLFFELLQVAIGTRDVLSCVPTDEEWYALYDLADKHSVTGLCFGAIEKMPREQRPPRALFMPWMGEAEGVKDQNGFVNEAIGETLRCFSKLMDDGLRNDGQTGLKCCVLKGQALARLYPRPELRTSGDIDLLIGDCFPQDALINRVCRMAEENGSDYVHATYHHCDYGKVKDVDVEIHWRASWFYTPWYNKRFQRFCQTECLKPEFGRMDNAFGIPVPTQAFDLVFILVHIYRHLFFEGIGMRQLVDYYMVAVHSSQTTLSGEGEGMSSHGDVNPETSKAETMQLLRHLGMARFTAAMMWIMREVLGMDEAHLLCRPNEKDGRFLLSEVMMSGNFGHHDERYAQREGESYYKFALRKVKRNLKLFRFGGWEMTFTPLWRMWHIYWWMKRHNEKVKLQ